MRPPAQTHNLHNLLNHWEFLGYGMLAVVLAASWWPTPFTMNFARRAALFVSRKVSHEAIIATFVGLIVVISVGEGQLLGLLVILTMGLLAGCCRARSGSTPACSSWGTTRRC